MGHYHGDDYGVNYAIVLVLFIILVIAAKSNRLL